MTNRLAILNVLLLLALSRFAPLQLVGKESNIGVSQETAAHYDEDWAAAGDEPSAPICSADPGVGTWGAGVDLVFVRPHFGQNIAFSRTESDGVGFANTTDVAFDYDYSLAPRVWVDYQTPVGIGLRASYFAFDQGSAMLTANPPANGFGLISHPAFGAVDISSTIPTESFSARSGLDLYSIDLEMTKRADFSTWLLLAGAGVRYASIEQEYLAQLRNGANALAGQINFRHDLSGFGPTVSVQSRRPLAESLGFFGMARGSLLFGQGHSSLQAGEDLDLALPFITTRTSQSDSLLPIGEIQVGLDACSRLTQYGQFTTRVALEGQLWGGVGNASSESGALGLLGLSVGFGLSR